ncbi:TRAP transporter substrate-binding protein DctP [Halomonas sp. MCCC 1A17488]|uniref:TRAP transporter substrate-binding protein DctP n=1 Tax=Billgrantia sulfidoxydans TaxID=2733484 RepID=A0ABX7W7B3_9GAMM|nr:MULTISPECIES: TRAP transporter substrate-binding protein DctP [Halomonas]MCE8017683.1 TRAP transporter substrate-binding protein DctP [Halomonas sp. MCCC 1A17488]MCG3241016.1 TRAP transporter substrate-binding protein DctP [Halomonas sp. MCCC 1A17488]QPP48882.1 TRAP transporter substrate-binding protein DctP [Halomonas sp. SS10-MC5]QTP56209.1 TRAP transporter substrate-binding protein DctP [Halomonas sulfidoxydans]
MQRHNTLTAFAAALGLAMAFSSAASANTVLRASHQFPGGQGDVRDEMVQMMARQVAEADVGLEIQVHPGQSLFKADEQWGALVRGRLDITSLPLDYASGRHPEFSATLMPGLVRNHEHAQRLNDSEYMEMIKEVIQEGGARVLADAWLSGGFASSEQCITSPDTVQGQNLRAAGPAFEQMLEAAGASIASMPSSEVYTAMQTGVLDAANTSSMSFISFRLYEQVECLTEPGDYALWFMYEPILISEQTWQKLNEEQQQALIEAGQAAEEYFAAEAAAIDQEMVEVYEENGVEVVRMSEEDYNAWLEIARETSYKNFAENVPNGQAIIDAALAVE